MSPVAMDSSYHGPAPQEYAQNSAIPPEDPLGSVVDSLASLFGNTFSTTGVMLPSWVDPSFVAANVAGTRPGQENIVQQLSGDRSTRIGVLRAMLGQQDNPLTSTDEYDPTIPGFVYMGHEKPTHVTTYDPETGLPLVSGSTAAAESTTMAPAFNNVTTVLAQPWTWDHKKQMETMRKMRAAGFTDVVDMDSMMSVWQTMVSRAAQTLQASGGKNLITPWDTLGLYKKEHKAAGMEFNHDGTVTKTAKRVDVADISSDDAWAAMKSQLQEMLGRNPTDAEVRDYMSRANALAAEHPTKTTSTYTTDIASGDTTTKTHEVQGFDASSMDRLAENMAEDAPDYEKTQAANYLNGLLAILDPVTTLG